MKKNFLVKNNTISKEHRRNAVVIFLAVLLPLNVYAQNSVSQRAQMVLQTGHSDDVLCAEFSADARFILTGSKNGEVKLWETAGGREIRSLYGQRGEVPSVSLTRDAAKAAASSADGTVFVWDTMTGELRYTIRAGSYRIDALSFSPDGSILVTGGEDTFVKLWEAETGRLIRSISGAAYGTITGISWNAESSLFAVSSTDKTVRLIDPFSGLRIKTFVGHTEPVTSCSLSPDGKKLISAGSDKTVRIWTVFSGSVPAAASSIGTSSIGTSSIGTSSIGTSSIGTSSAGTSSAGTGPAGEKVIKYDGSDITSIAFSRDGRFAAAAGGSRTVRVYDTVSGKTAAQFSSGLMTALYVTFSADGTRLAVTNTDNSIGLFDSSDVNPLKWKNIRTLAGNSANVLFAVSSPDGLNITFGNLSDSRIFFADAVTGKKTHSLLSHTRPVSAGIYTKDGSFFIAGGYDGIVKFYQTSSGSDMQQWKETGSFPGHSATVRFIAHNSANGDTATADEKGNIIIWKYLVKKVRTDGVPPDTDSHEFIADQRAVQLSIRLYEEKCTSLAFTADGKYLVSSSDNGKIYAAETQTYRAVKIAGGHSGGVNSLTFTADGRYMASSGSDSYIKIWNVSNWALVRSLDVGKRIPGVLLFSPDDSLLAAACSDNSIIVIDSLTGKLQRTLAGHQRAVTSLTAVPGGGNEHVRLSSGNAGILPGGNESVRLSSGNAEILPGGNEHVRLSSGNAGILPGGFVSASADGSLRWWSFSDTKWRTALKCVGANEYLIWNYDGFYDGTPWAVHNLLHFAAGMEVYPLDMKNGELYRPDLF